MPCIQYEANNIVPTTLKKPKTLSPLAKNVSLPAIHKQRENEIRS